MTMCAWPAAAKRVKCWGRGYHRPRLDATTHHGRCVDCGTRGGLGALVEPLGWSNARDRLAWWWEKRLTCGLGRHHSKMDSWPHCYRCGKQIGTMVRLCVYCTVRINPAGPTAHEVWCSRNLRGVAEPTFDPAACTCLADRDPAPDAHLEGCRAWAVWR